MITVSDLERIPLFAELPEKLRARVASRCADIRVGAGEWFLQEGDVPYFWALLEGEVEALKFGAGKLRQATTFDPGEFFGEVPLMLGTTTFFGMRALGPSRLIRLEGSDFHALISESAEVAACLAQTLVRRVKYIYDHSGTMHDVQATIVGNRYDVACHDIRDFLSRNHVAFSWLDPTIETDLPYIPEDVRSAPHFPVVLLGDGRRLACPTTREIADALGFTTSAAGGLYDVAIIGGGPAGLAAGVYGGSEGLRTLLIEREATGGQAGTSSRIENYLGFPGGVTGDDLATRALQQAQRFGTEILVTRSVAAIRPGIAEHTIVLDGDEEIRSRTIVLATGVTWRTLDVDGAARLTGRGVFYGAARTEALGTRGQDVFLIGGGNSAGQAAMYFANYARSVTLLVRGADLARTMSFYLIEQLRSKANIFVETGTIVTAVGGTANLETISTRTDTTEPHVRKADALFTFIGADAFTSWLPEALERDSRGYLRTGHDVRNWPSSLRAPYQLETSVPGIFAAGDVRSDSIKRVASGVGEGSVVISFIHQYLAALDTLPVHATT